MSLYDLPEICGVLVDTTEKLQVEIDRRASLAREASYSDAKTEIEISFLKGRVSAFYEANEIIGYFISQSERLKRNG